MEVVNASTLYWLVFSEMVINPDGINLSKNMDLYLIFKVGFIENVLYLEGP